MTTLAATLPVLAGQGLVQQRRLVTEIPGPASRQFARPRDEALAAGLSSGIGVYVDEALGVLDDAFRNL